MSLLRFPRLVPPVAAALLLGAGSPLRAQATPPDTTRVLPATAAALETLADSLCGWAARAAARGDSARVDLGALLRPAVAAHGTARCPTRMGPTDWRMRTRLLTFRLVEFQVEGDSVRVGLEVESADPGVRGFDWSVSRYVGVVRPAGAGRWHFARRPWASVISDGVVTLIDSTGRRLP